MPAYKILHVIENISPRFGGPSKVCRELCSEIVHQNHSATIFTTHLDFPKGLLPVPTNEPVVDGGVVFRYFPVQFRPPVFSFQMAGALYREIWRYDLVHIHGLYRFPVSYAAWRARKAGIPYIIRPYGSLDPFLFGQSRYGPWALPLKRLYERLFDMPNLHHAAAVHFTTQEERKLTAFLGLRAPPMVVPNGIDGEQYAILPASGAFRLRIGIDRGRPLVLFLGRINFKKGLDVLIPAFGRMLEKRPDVFLAVVGPDNDGYGKKVRRMCRDRGIRNSVFFVDHLGPEAVKQAYTDSDLFVLPSYSENFGMAVVEAMACGCPVVISDKVNIWREVADAGAGIVVSCEPGSVVRGMEKILDGKEKCRRMGRAGKRLVRERFNWKTVVRDLIGHYERLIVDHPRGNRRS